MLAIITKANDDYWYELKEINTIKELFDIRLCCLVALQLKWDIIWDECKLEEEGLY